eukprot:2399223-Amphidinium_carterae.1
METVSEAQAQAIYAAATSSYSQHRREIQGHRLARGFPAPAPSKGKGRSFGDGGKGKKDRSLQALIQRTRCARCGVIGHWARTCKAESTRSDAGGGSGNAGSASGSASGAGRAQASTKTYATFFVHSDVPAEGDSAQGDGGREGLYLPDTDQNVVLLCDSEKHCEQHGSAQGMASAVHASASKACVSTIWSGISALSPTCSAVSNTFLAVLDTGAQSTVCGSLRWAEFETKLRGCGLNAVKTESTARGTKGIGGEARCLGIWNTPIGIGGCNGLMSVTVLEGDAPFLLSVAMQKQFLMQLDLCAFTVAWRRIQSHSHLVELSSGHLAVDILDFADGKWTPPA